MEPSQEQEQNDMNNDQLKTNDNKNIEEKKEPVTFSKLFQKEAIKHIFTQAFNEHLTISASMKHKLYDIVKEEDKTLTYGQIDSLYRRARIAWELSLPQLTGQEYISRINERSEKMIDMVVDGVETDGLNKVKVAEVVNKIHTTLSDINKLKTVSPNININISSDYDMSAAIKSVVIKED